MKTKDKTLTCDFSFTLDPLMGLSDNTENQKIRINNDCYISLRGNVWQFNMWVKSRRKTCRATLKTKDKGLAIQKAKQKYAESIKLIQDGKGPFSLTLKDAVDLYLAHRKNDIYTNVNDKSEGKITIERWKCIRYQLRPFLQVYGPDTQLTAISSKDGMIYEEKRNKDSKNPPKKTTLKNEKSAINSLFKWLELKGHTTCMALRFK